MARRKEYIKTLQRRRDFLEHRLEMIQASDNTNYPGEDYDRAELGALNWVLKQVGGENE